MQFRTSGVRDDCSQRSWSALPAVAHIVRPEVTIENPRVFPHKLLLNRDPLISRCCYGAWLPEHLVQLDDRDPEDIP